MILSRMTTNKQRIISLFIEELFRLSDITKQNTENYQELKSGLMGLFIGYDTDEVDILEQMFLDAESRGDDPGSVSTFILNSKFKLIGIAPIHKREAK